MSGYFSTAHLHTRQLHRVPRHITSTAHTLGNRNPQIFAHAHGCRRGGRVLSVRLSARCLKNRCS